MASLLGYTITETINATDEFELFRAQQKGHDDHVLILGTTSDRPAPSTIALMEHEFELRTAIPAQVSVVPLAFERSGTKAYLVMQDPGGEVAEKLMASKSDASLDNFLKMAVNIAEALGDIHAEGFIHGDIRPGNLLVNAEDHNVSIMGFGVATKDIGVVESLESQNIPLEQMAYLSPEKTGRMNRAVDTRSDLYSLGVTLFQLLTRKLPFDAENVMEWVHCHVARAPSAVSEFKADVPSVLESIVLKLLEKNAEERYQTAQGLAADLKNCLTQWVANQSIDAFELGMQDQAGQLNVIDKVYGRIEEKRQIHQLLDKALHGQGESLVLRGPSGMGKTTLATEVLSAVDTNAANVIAVKFEASESNVPYTFIVNTVKEFVRQTLFKSEDVVQYWKEKITNALQENAKVAMDIAPDLELLIGEQPDVIPLPTNEAKKRFQSTLLKLYQVLSDQEHPLIMFLDDFDSVDTASLEFIQTFVEQGYQSCLMIFAYKTNDMAEGNTVDGFATKLTSFDKVNTSFIELGPLSQADISALTADALNESAELISEFTQAVYDKTGGSPFFSVQFLESCIEEKNLTFNQKQGQWSWDLDAINAKTFSDNVVEVLLNKIEKLPEQTKHVLEVFSCAGTQVQQEVLATLCEQSLEELESNLQEALQAGFVVQADGCFTFTHERIKSSAYQMMSEAEQNETHLKVARLFKQNMSEAEVSGAIFSVVFQWNRAVNLVVDESEKSYVRLLNKMAGVKAKASTAYQAARDYFFLVNLLTTEATWGAEYENTLFSYLELLECEFLLGQHEKADEWSNVILGYAQSEIDKSKVYEMRMRVYQLTGKLEDAISAGLMGLELFDYHFPTSEEELAQLCEQEKSVIESKMAGREISSLVDLPPCTDARIETIISLMTDLGPCLAIVRPKSFLYVLQVMKSISLSLEYGFTPKSCFMLQNYARRLITHGKDVNTAAAFANVALEIYAKFDDKKMKGTILFFDAVYLNHWQDTIEKSFGKFENAFNACTAIGNFGFASFSAYFLVTHMMDQGQNLEKVYEIALPYLEFAQKIHNTVLYEAILLYIQHISSLQLEASETMHEDCAKMSEPDRFEWLKNAMFAPGIGGYMILKQRTSLIYRQYAPAVGIGRVVGAKVAPGGLAAASYNFVQALALINLQRHGQEKPHETLEGLNEELTPFFNELKFMASCCPENFQDRFELVQAEWASLEGRFHEAEKHYEFAIQYAHDNGFSMNEALAYELAGVHYRTQNKSTISNAYLFKAMETYKHIGATAKVKQLTKLYPGLKEEFGGKAGATGGGNFDVMAIVSASQAMSSEIVLDNVIKYLMTIVLENAGAVRGLLILPFDEGYKIAAEAKTGKEISVDLQHAEIAGDVLPESIYQYVVRSKKNLLLDNAFDSKDYAADAYVQKNRAKSILFLPLIKQGKMTGILYLENNLSTGAFTADRMTVLEMLISQASISIENARLYQKQQEAEAEIRQHRDHLEELVAERTVEIKQKTNDIESMLKNMDLGICTIVPGNTIHHEYSPYLEVIFSESELADKDFMDAIFSKTDLGSDALDQVNVALSAIIDSDAMMYDFNSHLLVDEVTITAGDFERTIQIDWSPIVNEDDVVEKMLFISKDVTHLKELEADFAQQRESLMLISQIIKVDAAKFNGFIQASRDFVVQNRELVLKAQTAQNGVVDIVSTLFRNMHTIKGNSRTYNFGLVTEAAHQAEHYYDLLRQDSSLEVDYDQMLEALAAVEQSLQRYESVNNEDLGRGQQEQEIPQKVNGVVLNDEMLAQLQTLLIAEARKGNESCAMLSKQINALKLVKLEQMVGEVAQSLSTTAEEIGKPLPVVRFSQSNLGFEPGIKSVFQDSLMHLLRNALDHGIESPQERQSKGKPEEGQVLFEPVFHENATVTLYISDDGRGLAVHKLYEKGLETGLFSAATMPSLNDIAEVIFNSGLSTAEAVTDVSGRGVGMDAVRVFLEDIGASVTVDFCGAKEPSSPQELDFTPFKFAIHFKLGNVSQI